MKQTNQNASEKNRKEEIGEDATKYGEFVCSSHGWLPIDEQKEKSKKLEKMTKKK